GAPLGRSAAPPAPAADARALRVLLRRPAFHGVRRPRSGVRLAYARGRHRQTPVHHRGLHGIPHVDSTRGDLDQPHDAAARPAVDAAAPAGVRHRRIRRLALLLAGKEGRARAPPLRRGTRASPRLPGGADMAPETAEAAGFAPRAGRVEPTHIVRTTRNSALPLIIRA